MIPAGPDQQNPFIVALETARLWSDGAFAVERVLTQAARRSAEATRAVLDAGGKLDIATFARLGDLSRAQWFLWTVAWLVAGEQA
ncbi:MAG TPA: hypothetical protein VGB40_00155, partial [Rubrobacteraceae bacterium]